MKSLFVNILITSDCVRQPDLEFFLIRVRIQNININQVKFEKWFNLASFFVKYMAMVENEIMKF